MILSIVIPVYNEQEALRPLLTSIRTVMAGAGRDYEVVLIDDGSVDATADVLRHAAADDSRIKVLFFSRNFGHQAAITAGMDLASGDAVVVMDADLQDPAELLPEMLTLLERDYDVVSAQRLTRTGEKKLKLVTAGIFYWMIRKMVDHRIQPEVGDFRMFSRRAIIAIRQLREQHRFMRGMVAWLGLKEVVLPYHRNARIAGRTNYSWWKMTLLAWTAISSFSALPLRISIIAGLLVTGCGFAYLLFSLYSLFFLRANLPGWTSLMCLNIIFSGAILMAIGLVGEYVARIYEEAKGRPLYVIADSINIPTPGPHVARAVVLPPLPGYSATDYE